MYVAGMENEQVNNKSHLKEIRRELRNNATPAEAELWKYLKCRQLAGKRFRRQFSVDYYILDFYCPEEKLAVELDGAHHFTKEGLEQDLVRTHELGKHGIRVLRFENNLVFTDLQYVLDKISCKLTSPNPS